MIYRGDLREIQIAEGKLQYTLIRKPVKNINLRIKPDGQICVSANETVSAEYVDNFVRSKQRWILGMMAKREAYKAHHTREEGSKQYVSGENFRILGKDVRLKVQEGEDASVSYDGVFLYLTVQDKNDYEEKQHIVNAWMAEHREKVYSTICADIHRTLKKYGVPFPQIKIRSMTSRWGSCRPQRGRITLNSRLIDFPKSCIEYVVLHELTHFIYPNHSNAFYDFLSVAMPDWKDRKRRLEAID